MFWIIICCSFAKFVVVSTVDENVDLCMRTRAAVGCYDTHQPNRDNLTTTTTGHEMSMQSKLKVILTKKDTEDGPLLSKLFLTSFWQNDARKMWHVGLLSARADSTTCVVFRHASIHLWLATQKMINQWGLKLYVMPYIRAGARGQYQNIAQM